MLSAVVSATFAASAGPAGSAGATAYSAVSAGAIAVSAADSVKNGPRRPPRFRSAKHRGPFLCPRRRHGVPPRPEAVTNKKPASGPKARSPDATTGGDRLRTSPPRSPVEAAARRPISNYNKVLRCKPGPQAFFAQQRVKAALSPILRSDRSGSGCWGSRRTNRDNPNSDGGC